MLRVVAGIILNQKRRIMSRNKTLGKKNRLIRTGKVRSAPRWADIKKFSLKRARTRRISVRTRNWRRDKMNF